MRRSALQALCRLALRPAAGPPQATLPAAAASILVDECSSLTTAALHTAGSSSPPPLPPAAAVAARAPARPFSSAAAAGSPHVDQPVSEATHSEFQQQQYLHQQEPRRQQRRWQSREAPDPASPLGRLAACGSAQDLRAWQQELVAQGSFGPEELAAAIRLLFIPEQRGGLALQGADREAALRELVDAACSNPDATLDGRAGEAMRACVGAFMCAAFADAWNSPLRRCLPACRPAPSLCAPTLLQRPIASGAWPRRSGRPTTETCSGCCPWPSSGWSRWRRVGGRGLGWWAGHVAVVGHAVVGLV